MRILHTSDWHLGVEAYQHTRHEEQRRFLSWLLTTIAARSVDVLVVAGDVFDTTNPPAEALQLYYAFLAQLAGLRGQNGPCTAVVVGGNHDSPSRLDAPRDILSVLQTHVVGGYAAEREGSTESDPAGQVIPLRDASGAVGVVAVAVPYLNDWRIGVRGFDGTAAEQRKSLNDAFRSVYSRLADKAAAAFPGVPIMATGHLTCLAKEGDKTSVDDAIPVDINRVGTLGAMGPGVFDDRFAYVALGHIHRGFSVDPLARIRYAGTPVQVGPDEGADNRRVLLVEVGSGPVTVESLAVPVSRRIVRLRGPAEVVRTQLAALTWAERELPPYVVVEASVAGHEPKLGEELRARVPSGPGGMARVVDLKTPVVRAAVEAGGSALDVLPLGDAVTPEQAFRFAWSARFGDGEGPPLAILSRFQRLVESAEADAP
jgi:exonuclease SbcD